MSAPHRCAVPECKILVERSRLFCGYHEEKMVKEEKKRRREQQAKEQGSMSESESWGIPCLDETRLASVVPTQTYAGGTIDDPERTLFLWRSVATEKAAGGTLCFYLNDSRLEVLWRTPSYYGRQFQDCGITTLVEPDYSVWRDDGLLTQVENIRRTRTVGRIWQGHGLNIVPNLNWGPAHTFKFCFSGIPKNAPLTACECRTAGSNDYDRRAFLRGLREAVKQLEPKHILIYGGQEHAYWLQGRLPKGPGYTLLESWTSARRTFRAAHDRQEQDKYQLQLFTGGESWADEGQTAA